jgi:PadR family transcriptional regulator PadR
LFDAQQLREALASANALSPLREPILAIARRTLACYCALHMSKTQASESEWTSQLRRGVIELCVLRLIGDEPNYGYEIVTRLAAFPPLAASENTVYPLLRRLKADRNLETFSVDSPAGPPRQYYRLTARGRQKLATLEAEWSDMASAVARCLNGGAR